MSMDSVTNTLDCMHDQQMVIYRNALSIVVNSSGGGYCGDT